MRARRTTIADVATDEFVRVMVTNALSPMRVIEALEDLVPAAGTIGVTTSGLGSVANNVFGTFELYRGSKAALNTFMRSFAARHKAGRQYLDYLGRIVPWKTPMRRARRWRCSKHRRQRLYDGND